MASCIALYVDCNILILSISFDLHQPTPYAIAFSFIMLKASALFFSFNFFESLTIEKSKSCGKITAAATTGPAKHPRPTSSIPASTTFLFKYGLRLIYSFY